MRVSRAGRRNQSLRRASFGAVSIHQTRDLSPHGLHDKTAGRTPPSLKYGRYNFKRHRSDRWTRAGPHPTSHMSPDPVRRRRFDAFHPQLRDNTLPAKMDAFWWRLFTTLGGLLLVAPAQAKSTAYIDGTDLDGVTRQLAVGRTPALYTGDFGDCLGGQSLLNVTKFDAAFYRDNSTVLFHLDGFTNLKSESLMLYISLETYGVPSFNMTVDPCSVGVNSLCPMNASVPITAFAAFQVAADQVSGIPRIAYELPDCDGYARIQLFANSSQTEIGCFQAVLRNGASFSQPKAISSILAIFTAVAVVASFVTAAYGVSLPHMRSHYAHSLSVLVVLETLQSIFFSGALSLPWPSVLTAWWSNFAWASGFIPAPGMVQSVDSFAGISGNTSQVGGAGSTIINNNGGSLVQQIYGRSLAVQTFTNLAKRTPGWAEHFGEVIKRQASDPDDPYAYDWNGNPVAPGMPIPGDWSGFAGTLSVLRIPAADAFMVAFIWLLIVLAIVGSLITAFRFTLEALAKLKWIKPDRFDFFRVHWKDYVRMSLLRTLFIAFPSICIMATFQFAHGGRTGPVAIAAIVFTAILLGTGGLALYALRVRLRFGKFASEPDRILLVRGTFLGCIPSPVPLRLSQIREQEFAERPLGSLPFVHWHFIDDDPNRIKVHHDQPYIERFGWLFARFKLSRWWYFVFWLGYQLVRACFIGAATTSPLAQVFGLFIVDVLSFVVITAINPYEGQRNTTLAVWLLGLAKIATTGLSIAFLPDFSIDRILATIIGVVIVVIQALLTIALIFLIIIGSVSSWFSLTRNREYFTSEKLEDIRIKYFEHVNATAPERIEQAKESLQSKRASSEPDEKPQEPPKESAFSVKSVRRISKIEDEDYDHLADMEPQNAGPSTFNPGPMNRTRRTNSVSSRHSVSSLPRRARSHRTSWSSRDFNSWQAELDRPGTALAQRLNEGHTSNQSTVSAEGVLKHQTSRTSFRATETPVPGSRPMSPAQEEVERKGTEDGRRSDQYAEQERIDEASETSSKYTQ
ncbi:hypothetical protein JX265_001630 [Neoarthrinium moseri]|uniref:ML-like domain-containing protein n=1 Tax=Neoarthrinium moseri TaxID=1658444 RepID=A0A9Q0ATH4_9PEZI|nr:hypothetical protein JX265_001630 [Neoarthrinium moseri]